VNARIERLRAELDRLGAASFLVTNPVNVEYLTGFASSNAFVLVKHKQVVLLTDGRYIEAAGAVEGVEVVELDRDLPRALAPRLGSLAEAPVAVEAEHVTLVIQEHLRQSGLELLPTTGVVLGLRAVKEPGELETIRRAARILSDVYGRLAHEGVVGKTERELAWWFEQELRAEGAHGVAFPTIVASGSNAALPHHQAGDRRIEAREVVLVDAGARLDGYCSDCTRTFATGPLPEELQRAYSTCWAAQEAALAGLAVGADAKGLDAMAASEVAEGGFEVKHGLGHGVGLEVHELPVLRPEAEGSLAAGNVVTIEPGVYLPGLGGVRIEDLVIVTDDGPEVVTSFTKELLTLE
jgi:Xaa-Pro aminopeptidase